LTDRREENVLNRLRKLYLSEKEKLKGYSLQEKLSYIAEYYWLHILLITGSIAFVIYFVYHAFFTVKENWFYITFVNTLQEAGEDSALCQDFIEYAGYDLSEKNVLFNSACYFDAARKGGTNNSYYQAFIAAIEAGAMDAAVMERDNFEAVARSGRFQDLSVGEAAELFAPYEDLFVYCLPYDETYSETEVPVGIDLSGSPLVTEYGLYEDGCVLGLSAYSQHPEEVVRFLEYLGVKTQEEK
jgi:hypothetical protein